MILPPYWNQKKEETKKKNDPLSKDEFIYGEGKAPQLQCALCGYKAWYIGIIAIWCSNEKCKWYKNPHKEQEEQEE